jgi:hypothetical protein
MLGPLTRLGLIACLWPVPGFESTQAQEPAGLKDSEFRVLAFRGGYEAGIITVHLTSP